MLVAWVPDCQLFQVLAGGLNGYPQRSWRWGRTDHVCTASRLDRGWRIGAQCGLAVVGGPAGGKGGLAMGASDRTPFVAGAKNPPKSGENRTPSHNRRSNYFAARAAAFACRSSFASLRRYESATNFTISA